MYLYNPSEPAGVPVQPGPDIRASYLASAVDQNTLGRCGNCAACPKVWRLEMLTGDGDSNWAGTWYLKRNSYFASGDRLYQYQNCSWESEGIWGDFCPITDATQFADKQFTDSSGWVLSFHNEPLISGNSWYLRSPIYIGPAGETYCSLWQFDSELYQYRCLQANAFVYAGKGAEFDWPLISQRLVLTPFYG